MDYTIPQNFDMLTPAQRAQVLARMTVQQRVLLWQRAERARKAAAGMAGLFDWVGDVFNTVKDVVVKAAPIVGGVVSIFNPAAGIAITTAGKLVGGGGLPWETSQPANNTQGPPQAPAPGGGSIAPLLIGGALLLALGS